MVYVELALVHITTLKFTSRHFVMNSSPKNKYWGHTHIDILISFYPSVSYSILPLSYSFLLIIDFIDLLIFLFCIDWVQKHY